jgi:hypothetical protein
MQPTVRWLTVSALTVIAAGAIAPSGGAAVAPWERYVTWNPSATVTPVRVVSVSGSVTNPSGLVGSGRGVTTLRMVAAGPPPVIVLDYGKDIGGIPELNVESTSGSPTIRASFSESGRYIGPIGDNGGNGSSAGAPATEPHRWDDWTPSGAGVLRTTYQQGGERFERIALTSAGTVALNSVTIQFKAYRATPAQYQGWFLSSDGVLNRIWYAGAYTVQLDMVPPHTQANNPQPVVVDGAKRDRIVWSGDLLVEGPTIWNTLGRNGSDYIKQSLLLLARHASPQGVITGAIGVTGTLALYYSLSYSMDAADAMIDYYRYTGDRGFARQVLPTIERNLQFFGARINGQGLLPANEPGVGVCCTLDWDLYDGAKPGVITEYNVIYYHSLLEAAYVERNLGRTGIAASYTRRAAALRRAINQTLFNTRAGLYSLSAAQPGEFAQDANALAVLYGVAPEGRVAEILRNLKHLLWTRYGTRPFSANTGYSPVISPYISGFETAARLTSSDDTDALDLMRRLWGIMVRPGIDYTGALWEKLSPQGTVAVLTGSDPVDNQSLAHGWSTGPTWQLSQFVLGASPVAPGYKTWTASPHLGNLRWAKGQVPTPAGPITLNWTQNRLQTVLHGEITGPKRTRGQLVIPVQYRGSTVLVDGRRIRAGTTAVEITGGKTLEISMTKTARP